jgi:hypothetical protein
MQKAFPRKNSPCVSRPGFFPESIQQFPGKGCLAENPNTNEVTAEFRNSTMLKEGLEGECVFEFGIPSKRVSRSTGVGIIQENHSEFTVNSP